MRTPTYQRRPRRHRSGLTLVELVVVLAILAAIAGIAIPRLISTADTARETSTQSSAIEIRDAVIRFWSDCKYAYPTTPVENQRIQLAHLLEPPSSFPAASRIFDPNVRLGWHGPYMQSDGRNYTVDATIGFTTNYGSVSQPAIRDSFASQDYDGDGNKESGRPFVIQEPTLLFLGSAAATYTVGEPREVRVVSAGPNGILEIEEGAFATDLEAGLTPTGDDIYVTFVLR